jgi:hypothetical protein
MKQVRPSPSRDSKQLRELYYVSDYILNLTHAQNVLCVDWSEFKLCECNKILHSLVQQEHETSTSLSFERQQATERIVLCERLYTESDACAECALL